MGVLMERGNFQGGYGDADCKQLEIWGIAVRE